MVDTMSDPPVDLIPNLVKVRHRTGRCTYDKAAKRELVRRCLQPGVSLARTALEHGINANLLRKWVLRQTGSHAPKERVLRSVVASTSRVAVRTESIPLGSPRQGSAHLEIVVAGGTIRVFGPVDAAALSTALTCLARQP
jgi:transposase